MAKIGNTMQDKKNIKKYALPLTFEYGLAICDKNSLHYDPKKCDTFRFNSNAIYDTIYSTIFNSREKCEYKYS